MSELKLEVGLSYHTDSGTLVKIVSVFMIPTGDSAVGVCSMLYVGDNDNLYNQHGVVLEQKRLDKTLFTPESLIYPYGGKHPKYSNQNVLDKITELKQLVEASGLSVEMIIK